MGVKITDHLPGLLWQEGQDTEFCSLRPCVREFLAGRYFAVELIGSLLEVLNSLLGFKSRAVI